MDTWKRLTGGAYPGFSNSTYLGELSCADRNFCLAYFMRERKSFPDEMSNIDGILRLYFQLFSIEVNAEQLSIEAATLA